MFVKHVFYQKIHLSLNRMRPTPKVNKRTLPKRKPATAVKAGAIITPTADLQFSEVELASGSVALVLG